MNASKFRPGLYVMYLLVSLVAAVAGFSIYQAMERPPGAPAAQAAPKSPNALLGTKRPAFSLPDINGETVSISRWNGDIVLVNFWATWCAPCREEIPAFSELQANYGERGFRVVGVAIDQPRAVSRFIEELGVHYPQLVGQEKAVAVAERYGNHLGALPYSVLIDRMGIIRFVRLGQLRKQELKTELLKLL